MMNATATNNPIRSRTVRRSKTNTPDGMIHVVHETILYRRVDAKRCKYYVTITINSVSLTNEQLLAWARENYVAGTIETLPEVSSVIVKWAF